MKRRSMVAMGAALMVAASALSVAPAQALSIISRNTFNIADGLNRCHFMVL